MNIRAAEFIVFDVETTGLSPNDGHRIIEIAAMKVRGMQVVDKFYSLINPQRTLPAEAMSVNMITEDMLVGAPLAADVLPGMIDFIGGGCVCGHNVKFDLGFLCHELARAGRRLREETPAIDTLKMARDLLPYLSNHKLSYLARSLGITVNETHRAMADVEITVKVLMRLIEMAEDKDLGNITTFLGHFGVDKPAHKFVQAVQSSLF